MTAEDRASATAKLIELERLVDPYGPSAGRQKISVITKMLLAYPAPGASEQSGQARAEAYLYALDDIPSWAVDAAIKKWHRGECGEQNYSWAPAPAILRQASERVLVPVREAIARISALDNAQPLDELMEARSKNAVAIIKCE